MFYPWSRELDVTYWQSALTEPDDPGGHFEDKTSNTSSTYTPALPLRLQSDKN